MPVQVMLRDVDDSRRVTAGIHKHFGDDDIKAIDVTVVSRTCWPTMSAETFDLPEPVKSEMDRYEKQYLHAKAPRKLAWKPTLGCVTLDVHFDEKVRRRPAFSPPRARAALPAATASELPLAPAGCARHHVHPDARYHPVALWPAAPLDTD